MSINPLLPRLDERVGVFHDRLVAAEKQRQPKKIRLVEDEFIRFVANVSLQHGTDFASYCISRMPKPSDQDRVLRLVQATRRLRNEPQVDQFLADSWEALMPGHPRPQPKEGAE